MATWLKRALAIRSRISAQLYLGIGGAVFLTLAASLVGWFSFARVGEVQTRVNEGSVPELTAAFGVAQSGGSLVNAAPTLTAASDTSEFNAIAEEIDQQFIVFNYQLRLLAQERLEGAGVTGISRYADRLIANIQQIRQEKRLLFELEEKRLDVQIELEDLRQQLTDVLTPALDNQLFYALTGYRDINEPAVERDEHFSEDEFINYRLLSELQADANDATSILANASTLSDRSFLEPLRERFEAVASRIERNLTTMTNTQFHRDSAHAFSRLLELGLGDDDAFSVFEEELRMLEIQSELLSQNRPLSESLVAEVDKVVIAAEAAAKEATLASEDAMLTGRSLLFVISALSVLGAFLIIWLFVGRYLLRRLGLLTGWMRSMARGDLEAQVEISGRDEIADMASTLDVLRRHALEVQRLNLVEELAEELQAKNEELEEVLETLSNAQDQIVAREKLAALGELTAGVAHEIKNPLNFVKNFSEASQELIEEFKELIEDKGDDLDEDTKSYVDEITDDLTGNVGRIKSHAERADRIVRDMLMMGRDSGDWQMTDINALLEQHAQLSFHSARALDPDFQLDIQEDLDPALGQLEVIPQDLGRVFLNMVTNAGHATSDRHSAAIASGDTDYSPTLRLTTRKLEENAEVRVRDNGTGMPPEVIEKIFNPFFTTKPTNQGTGLGLSISNDIVRRHGGSIRVESEAGEYTEMIVTLPLERPSEDVEAEIPEH